MKMFLLDFSKYGLENLKKMHIRDFTDDDIKKLTNAFYMEDIAPRVSGIKFNPENVSKILSLSKCKKCGRLDAVCLVKKLLIIPV